MKTISNYIYLKQPGILYDMMFALKLRFNGERAINGLRAQIPSFENVEQIYYRIIEKLKDISDKLLPLFYCDESPRYQTGLLTYMRSNMSGFDYTGDGLIEKFYDSLRDVQRLKKFIYKNYVSENCPEIIDSITFVQIKDEVYSSDLPPEVKMYMADFLLYGEHEIEFFISELRKVQSLCEEIHQINSAKIDGQIAKFDDDKIATICKLKMEDIAKYNPIYHTYCVINMYSVHGEIGNGDYIAYLGINSDQLIYKSINNIDVDFYELGRILYDETRLKILAMLKEKPMYCAEVAKELGLKNNSTLYHLTMMEKQKLLRFVPKGKKIYYYINVHYLDNVRKLVDDLRMEII